jgi:hypothetical protein
MAKFPNWGTTVEYPCVSGFENDQATAAEACVTGNNRCDRKVGKVHMRCKSAALLNFQHWLFPRPPFGDADPPID